MAQLLLFAKVAQTVTVRFGLESSQRADAMHKRKTVAILEVDTPCHSWLASSHEPLTPWVGHPRGLYRSYCQSTTLKPT